MSNWFNRDDYMRMEKLKGHEFKNFEEDFEDLKKALGVETNFNRTGRCRGTSQAVERRKRRVRAMKAKTREQIRKQIAYFSSSTRNRLQDILRACEKQDDDEAFTENTFKTLNAVTANVRDMFRMVGYLQAIEEAEDESNDKGN